MPRKRPRPPIGQPPIGGDDIRWHDEEGQREHDAAVLRDMGRVLRKAVREFVTAWRHRHDR